MKKILCTFRFLFLFNLLSAQDFPSPVNIDYTPPSPNASSLGKYGDIPVGYYTGIPKVEIPIYTISTKYLSLPISLSYHAGGIRVEETASSVGLGWSLNAGGVVSRSLMGLNDERTGRGFMKTVELPAFDSITVSYFNDINNGLYDGQADNFNFSFAEYVGKFVINKDEEVVKTPWSRMKLEFNQASNPVTNENEITKWTAVGEDGTTYIFEDREMTTTLESVNLIGETPPITEYPVPYASSWYITKIISANGLEEYTFEYESYTIEYYQNIVETVYSMGSKESTRFQSKIRVVGKRLKKIVFPTGTIEFSYFSGYRCDLIGDKALENIKVTDGSMVKEFDLGYSYFDDDGVSAWSTCSSGSSDHAKRLRLDYVTEAPGSSQPKRHTFEYNEDVFLPDKFSNAQDHWGFYNGKDNNTTLIPEEYMIAYSSNILLAGADREPSAAHVTAGCLKKITYPTGGNTEFDLGINYAQSDELSNDLELVGVNLGGIALTQDTAYIRRELRPFVELRFFGLVSAFASPDCFIQVTINGPGLHLPLKMFPAGSIDEKLTINIPEGGGNYIFSTSIVGPYNCTIEEPYAIGISWENELATVNKKASGVRVNKITNQPLFGEPTHQYFKYELQDSSSSGSVVTTPRYGYWYSESSYLTGMQSNFYVRTQFTNNPLMLTQGAVAGYSRVVVSNDSLLANGYTEYTYTSPHTFPDNYNNTSYPGYSCLEFPFAPAESHEWQRGLLLSKANYKKSGNDFVLMTKENNYYQYDIFQDVAFELPIKSVKTGVVARIQPGPSSHTLSIAVLTAHFYEFSVHKQMLARTIHQTYQGAHVLSDTVKYTYSTDFFLVDKSTHKSDAIFRSKYFYPSHYTSNTVMENMVAANIRNSPVSTESWIETQGGAFLLSGSSTEYINPSAGKFYPDAFWYFKGKVREETLDAINTSDVVRDAAVYEKYAAVVNRDASGNIREFIDRDSLHVTFLWDSARRYAVAKVINASYTEVYHTSFEETTGNTSGTSKTGNNSRILSGAFSISSFVQPIEGKDYVLTYWWKPTLQSNWELQVEEYNDVDLPLTIQTAKSTGYIDEVRFYPKDAQMSTFSYVPGVGVSTITDVNHVTARFEYDAQGRLICVRDKDGNILTNYQYNYLDPTLPYQP